METPGHDFDRMTGDELDAAQLRLEMALDELAAVRRSRQQQAEALERAIFDRLPATVSRLAKDEIGQCFVMIPEGGGLIVELRWREWVAVAHELLAADAAARGFVSEPMLSECNNAVERDTSGPTQSRV